MLTIQIKTAPVALHVAIIGGMCLFMSQKVLAEALFNHVVQPYVGTELKYDSNVLRLPNNFTPEMSGNKNTTSSFIKQIKAGLAINWQISQQQLIADVSINQNWYSTFNELNYTGHSLMGQWNWQLGRQLKGEISYNNRLVMGSFSQLNRLFLNNLENTENYRANVSYEIFQDWYLRTQFFRDSIRYSADVRRQSNLIENNKEFGFRYLNALDNMLGFRVTFTDGKYPNRDEFSELDNAFTRISYNIDGRWNYSVKTRIKGQIGYTSQKFKHITSRNFSNIVANGDILWQITPKSSLLLLVWREIYPISDVISSFSLNQGIGLTPSWTWSETPKIQVELPITYKHQANLGVTDFNNSAALRQQSTTSTIRLNLNYMPITNVEMSAYALYEKRHSSDPLHSYNDQSVGLTMKVSF